MTTPTVQVAVTGRVAQNLIVVTNMVQAQPGSPTAITIAGLRNLLWAAFPGLKPPALVTQAVSEASAVVTLNSDHIIAIAAFLSQLMGSSKAAPMMDGFEEIAAAFGVASSVVQALQGQVATLQQTMAAQVTAIQAVITKLTPTGP